MQLPRAKARARRKLPSHAVVTLPSLDMRFEPAHASELGSQLLMGEVVRILARADGGQWLRVRNLADGYSGWVRDWGLVTASAARVRRWSALALGRVAASIATVRAAPGDGVSVTPLFFGGRVIASEAHAGHRRVELPDGRRGWAEAAAFAGRRSRPLVERALGFLGVPYLWGGRTPAGYDCSGFVQQVLLEQDVALPRDAVQQHRACRALARSESAGPGDLAFFSRPGEKMSHVGLAMDATHYIHCRGRVQVSGLDPSKPLYDKALAGQFRGWSRPRRAR